MIVSLIIIILLIFGFLLGFKRGIVYQFFKMFGTILILVIASSFKDELGLFLFDKFPMFDLGIGLDSINILIYQSLAFIIIFFVLAILLRLVLKLAKNLEKLLKATIILAIPSKILGGILGFIEYYIYIFLFLVIINLPIFSFNLNSKVADFILDKTPLVSKSVNVDAFRDIDYIINSDSKNKEQKLIDLFKEKEIIDKAALSKLIDNGKIKA